MSIQAGIFTVLSSNTDLSAIVSNRIYPLIAPQNPTLPYITYQRISKIPTTNMDGISSLDMGRFQIDIWSLTYSEGLDIAKLLERSFDFIGQLDNQLEDYDSGSKLYRQTLDFILYEDKF